MKNINFCLIEGRAIDVEEMVALLLDVPGDAVKSSRLRAIFASRACRMSIMIGDPLNRQQMSKVCSRRRRGRLFDSSLRSRLCRGWRSSTSHGIAPMDDRQCDTCWTLQNCRPTGLYHRTTFIGWKSTHSSISGRSSSSNAPIDSSSCSLSDSPIFDVDASLDANLLT